MKENKELIFTVEVKETWAMPELEMVSVKESTLGAVGPVDDGLTFS